MHHIIKAENEGKKDKWLKKKIGKYTIIVKYVVNSLSLMYRTSRKSVSI